MNPYADLLDLPHHVSETHPQMSMHERAAQFSPFSTLSGYAEAVRETARPVETKKELSEDARAELDAILRALRSRLEAGEQPLVTVTYFEPDLRKLGGAYRTRTGAVRRVNAQRGELELTQGAPIAFADLMTLEMD